MENNPLVIAGSGRSGTTWVLDVIAKANNLRPVFEPLCQRGVVEARAFGRRYVRENAYEPELERFMAKVFMVKKILIGEVELHHYLIVTNLTMHTKKK